jgi:hypothetical protein
MAMSASGASARPDSLVGGAKGVDALMVVLAGVG